MRRFLSLKKRQILDNDFWLEYNQKKTMPKLSPAKQKELEKEKKYARFLYKQGFSMRAVASKLGRSRTWVLNAIPKKEWRTKRTHT